ncbi:GDSL-type esterase/lipase family protein [Paractinoplanes rishiriensis]|uniref:Lipoprotein n=1 Tax=Paractinoplanes rishiriensis TaxID=1050105 RepID=A0A919MT37_9ACTN|nr:SGNH/GDSL hydrolase family protein [Actinoplanes rishiriensis]GIE98856.1 lipoprotein [Actinoplanes rishiriensis]
MVRRWHVAVLAVLGVLALACEGGAGAGGGGGGDPAPTASAKGYPNSMAALGDSISAGFGSCGAYLVCGRNSWSTGTAEAVDSHYRRILAKNSKIRGNVRNFARPGAEADALAGQAARAVDMKAQYVTVLIGANDACADRVTGMTSVATFRAEVDRALDRLKAGLPKSRILVASIPDVYRLWEMGRESTQAVRVWDRLDICPSMLANPNSEADADEDRRRAVRDRIDAYNDELRELCRGYGKKCRWDGGQVHQVRYGLDRVNQVDYFHPNLEGQADLADVTFPRRFNW